MEKKNEDPIGAKKLWQEGDNIWHNCGKRGNCNSLRKGKEKLAQGMKAILHL